MMIQTLSIHAVLNIYILVSLDKKLFWLFSRLCFLPAIDSALLIFKTSHYKELHYDIEKCCLFVFHCPFLNSYMHRLFLYG